MKTPNIRTVFSWFCSAIMLVLLVAILTPSIGGPSPASPRMAAAANLRSIANAYQAYTVSGENHRTFTAQSSDKTHAVAELLAMENGLNYAPLWFVKQDKKLSGKNIPEFVLIGNTSDGKINPDFAKLVLSYEFAANVPSNASQATTPIAWTRGLRLDGTWDKNSPWKGQGGHIAYIDGHVEWVDGKLSTEPGGIYLLKFGENTPTANIREALPPGAVILSAEPNGAQR